jgi:hypothetical protein
MAEEEEEEEEENQEEEEEKEEALSTFCTSVTFSTSYCLLD